MNKQEYLNQVKEILNECDEQVVNEILADFEEHFELGEEAGKTEAEIAESLGDISEWIEELKQIYAKKQLPSLIDEVEDDRIRRITVQSGSMDVKIQGDADELSWAVVDDWSKMNVHNYEIFETFSRGRLLLEVKPKENQRFGIVTSHVHFVLNLTDELNEVRVETASGDIEVLEAEADHFKLHTRSGDVGVSDCEGSLWIKTQSGDIDIEECETDQIVLSSTSGDIDIKEVKAEELSAKSTSGEIEVELEEAEMVSLTSVSGDIEFEGYAAQLKLSSTSGDIEVNGVCLEAMKIETISGDVEVTFKDCTGLQGIIETCSGDIDIDLDGVSGRSHHFTWGDGSTKVLLKTVSGDISISED